MVQQGELDQNNNMGTEQKEMLEDYVLAGYELLYNEGEDVVNVANREGSTTKVEDAANALFMVSQKLDRSREQNNLPPIPDQVKLVGSFHLNEKVIEFAEHRGAKPFSPEEKKMAFQLALQKYMERGIKEGTIDSRELAIAAEKAQPGSIKDLLAKAPDDSNLSVEPNNQVPVVAPNQEESKGLLKQPSPLERFL